MASMRTPEDHVDVITQAITPRESVTVALNEALGRTLNTDIVAGFDSPRFDNSQMDGYALSARHILATPDEFIVGATLPAGTDPDELYPNGIGEEIVPIMTGAKVPIGTMSIVPVEAGIPARFPETGASVTLIDPIKPGRFIRHAGSDIRAGELLLPAGTHINPIGIGVLASQNINEVKVRGRHRVIICTGGAEINAAADHVASIPDSNGPMLVALCTQAGIDVVEHVRTDDDPGRLRADLQSAVERLNPSVIITSGGISAGEFEVVRQVLEPNGWFGHVAQQPGGPQGVASFQGVPVICLPGNPISTLVSFRLFVAPIVGTAPAPITARLSEDVAGLDSREQFLRGTYISALKGTEATPVGGAGSHLLAQATHANCLIRVPLGGLSAGAPVTVYPFAGGTL